MSWQAYVDTNLVGTGSVSQAGIYGINGGGQWAASPGFTVSVFFIFLKKKMEINIPFSRSSLLKSKQSLLASPTALLFKLAVFILTMSSTSL